MADFTQATIEAYRGFIDKPAMDPKLLSRPPFFYIMQIFVETSKKTGFGKGMYQPEELTKEYYTEPKQKLAFLWKLVHLVRMVEGKFDLAIEDIVRGQECGKTNEFLQKMAHAAKKGANTDEYVTKILEKAAQKQGGGAEQPAREEPKPAPREEAKPAPAQTGGHQREVTEMTRGAQIKPTNDVEAEDAGKIRMGTLNRAGTKTIKTDDKRVTETTDRNAQGATTIDGMKESIQNITQSINPMGKIIQFIDDDIESMKREYDSWARMYASSQEQLEDKEKAIEADLQPYKDKIVAKEEQIREKKGQIDSLKSRILRNNLKIKKLLSDIVGAN